MATKNEIHRHLCAKFGKKVSIAPVDGEECVLYDCGNKFDIEISGTHKTNRNARVNLYLWYDARICVKYVLKTPYTDIRRTINALQNRVDEIVSHGPIDESVLLAM